MAGRIQINHALFQQALLPGQHAMPGAPYFIMEGSIYVPASGRKPRPGDAVYYNETQNQWAYPTSAAHRLAVRAIVTWDKSTLTTSLAAIPSGSNSNQFVEYDDNQIAKIALVGIFAVTLGAATEAFEPLVSQADFKWDPLTKPTAIGSIHENPVVALKAGGDGDIVPAMIGMGRVI